MSERMPTLFVSHGSPAMAIEPGPARAFLAGLAAALPPPSAVLCISAHWSAPRPSLTGTAAPQTIHDFYGFPEALYRIRYAAPGSPALAGRAAQLLGGEGSAVIDEARGLDHGAWIPLSLAWPHAELPVVQLSLVDRADPAAHLELGRRLAPLRDEGVLIVASGGATHNLAGFRGQPADAPPEAYATAFADWLHGRILAGETDALCDYLRQGPSAARNHPTDEHLMPLFVALGAGGGVPGTALHRSMAYGMLAMDCYRWS